MTDHAAQQTELGVLCQNCGAPIRVPERVLARQIVVAEDRTEPKGRYVTTLLNLRCRACCKEYFYDVGEIVSVEGPRRSFPHSACSDRLHDLALERHPRAGRHSHLVHR